MIGTIPRALHQHHLCSQEEPAKLSQRTGECRITGKLRMDKMAGPEMCHRPQSPPDQFRRLHIEVAASSSAQLLKRDLLGLRQIADIRPVRGRANQMANDHTDKYTFKISLLGLVAHVSEART